MEKQKQEIQLTTTLPPLPIEVDALAVAASQVDLTTSPSPSVSTTDAVNAGQLAAPGESSEDDDNNNNNNDKQLSSDSSSESDEDDPIAAGRSALAMLMNGDDDDDDDDDGDFDVGKHGHHMLMNGTYTSGDDDDDDFSDEGHETDESDPDQAAHEYKEPRLGDSYQAQIPNLMIEKLQRVRRTLHRQYENDEREGNVIWVPTFLRDAALTAFLDKAEQTVASSQSERRPMAPERALELLHRCKYNRRTALRIASSDPQLVVEHDEVLDEAERQLVRYFLLDWYRAHAVGLRRSADWRQCVLNYVKTKSLGAVRDYYYRWKGSVDYRCFVKSAMASIHAASDSFASVNSYRVPPQRTLYIDTSIDWAIVPTQSHRANAKRPRPRPVHSHGHPPQHRSQAASDDDDDDSDTSSSASAYDSEDEYSSASYKRQRSHSGNMGVQQELQEQRTLSNSVVFHHRPGRGNVVPIQCRVVRKPIEPTFEQLFVDITDPFMDIL